MLFCYVEETGWDKEKNLTIIKTFTEIACDYKRNSTLQTVYNTKCKIVLYLISLVPYELPELYQCLESKCGSYFKAEETLSVLYKTQEQSLYWFILTLFQRIVWQESICTSLKTI